MAEENITLINALAPYILGLAGILSPLFTAKYLKNLELEKHKQSVLINLKIELYQEIYQKTNEIINLPVSIFTKDEWNKLTNEIKKGYLKNVNLSPSSTFDDYNNRTTTIFGNHLNKTMNELHELSNRSVLTPNKIKNQIQEIYEIFRVVASGVQKEGIITDPTCSKKIKEKIDICQKTIQKEVL